MPGAIAAIVEGVKCGRSIMPDARSHCGRSQTGSHWGGVECGRSRMPAEGAECQEPLRKEYVQWMVLFTWSIAVARWMVLLDGAIYFAGSSSMMDGAIYLVGSTQCANDRCGQLLLPVNTATEGLGTELAGDSVRT